ncbi:MAG: hypothetical protein FJX74_19685 [Armatimonadetes bacterium]|nr:hypothetical protein [Armatimonadota bacterium]
MGESVQEPLRVEFDARVRLEFVGSKITSDAGLLAYRELDEKLGLTGMACQLLAEQRSGRNVQLRLVPLLRQSIYSRLAGYPDTNDANRLSRDPAMRLMVSKRARAGVRHPGWWRQCRLQRGAGVVQVADRVLPRRRAAGARQDQSRAGDR